MWLLECTSSTEQQCQKRAACCTISPASSNPKPFLEQEGNMHSITFCVWERQTSVYPLTHVTRRLLSGRPNLLLEQSSANGSSMRRQQVIEEDDVVLRHKRFPLCPGWGWGLLFVPPVIAWRIDSEQYAVSRTVIKPHYSFFTTPIWVLETQWPTLKWRLCLVTVWPLPVLLCLPHFTAPALLSPYVSFESSALISPLCSLLFTEQSAIQGSFPL